MEREREKERERERLQRIGLEQLQREREQSAEVSYEITEREHIMTESKVISQSLLQTSNDRKSRHNFKADAKEDFDDIMQEM